MLASRRICWTASTVSQAKTFSPRVMRYHWLLPRCMMSTCQAPSEVCIEPTTVASRGATAPVVAVLSDVEAGGLVGGAVGLWPTTSAGSCRGAGRARTGGAGAGRGPGAVGDLADQRG